MLLNQIITSQHDIYAQIQSQIELLQEQQRQIQAYLQRLGGVESKMESAAQLVAEAIAEINAVCPDELKNYQRIITSLFGSTPIAQMNAAIDEPPTPAAPKPAPEPSTEPTHDNDGAIETTAVVVADEIIVVTATEANIAPTEPKEEVGESPTEPDFSSLTWKQLQKFAAANNLDPRGKKRTQIEYLLTQQGITQPEIDLAA